MKPKQFETYITGLQKTLEEKTFFVRQLPVNFWQNKIIIDFGCGDGSVLDHISKNRDLSGSILVAVDCDIRMLECVYKRAILYDGYEKCELFCSLTDKHLQELIKGHSQKEVVVIATSVLHELNDYQTVFHNFCERYADYLIIRDMCVNTPFATGFEHDNELLAKVIKNASPKHLSQFVAKYGSTVDDLMHFLLKYTYVENWETELEEDYLSTKWNWLLRDYTEEIKTECLYNRAYVQSWRRERVLKDFDIDLKDYTGSTHREVIVKITRVEEHI